MKYKNALVLICFLFFSSVFASERDSSKELMSYEELESTIMFLEDTQKINELVSRLRAIRDARKVAAIDTVEKKGAVSSSLLAVFNAFKNGVTQKAMQIRKELFSIPQKSSKINTLLLRVENFERMYSFLIVLLIATIAGGLFGILFWRSGEHLQNIADKGDKKYQKLADITARLLIKNAFSFALIGMGLVFILIPVDFEINIVTQKIVTALLVYIVACSVVSIIWNRRYPLLSLSNETSAAVIKNLSAFFRFSLIMYILYSITSSLLPGFSLILSLFYQVITIFWLPSILKRYNRQIIHWFTTKSMERKSLPKLMILVIKIFLSRINHIAFMFLLFMTLVWLAGYKNAYEKIMVGVLLSCLIMSFSVFLIVLWNSILLNFNRSLQNNSNGISEFSEFAARNMVFIRRSGLVVIIGISVIAISQVWGMSLGGVLNLENAYLKTAFRVIAILVGAFILIQMTKIIIERMRKEATTHMKGSNFSSSMEIEKRVDTLGNVMQKMAVGAVVSLAIIMVMDELGFDIKAMIAGVGIIGLAVGFGAQNLVRDIISGLFLIFENRIRVGDVAIINGTGGAVVQVNLRTTVLRSADGTVHVFPNGSINSLSNMTQEFSFYVFEISISYNENVDRVIKALKEVGEEIIADPLFKDLILEPLEIQGVDRFAESALVIKARIKTQPTKQWYVGREMNLRFKRKFDSEGIRIALPHRILCFDEKSKPFPLKLEGLPLESSHERKDQTPDEALNGA